MSEADRARQRPERVVKKRYEKPSLHVFGTLTDLTQTIGNMGADDNPLPGKGKTA